MRVTPIIISGFLFLSQGAYASTQDNPFLLPSERLAKVKKAVVPEIPAECVNINDSEGESPEDLAALLAKEIEDEENLPPEYQLAVLGDWTREDVENSRYIGLINGSRVYFHNEKRVFFSLDMSKAKNKDDKGPL